jgi:two-component system, OmpR family, response regulator MtrA
MPTLGGRRKILVVDDDPAVAESLRMLVSKQGHETRVAQSAEEAFELIASWEPALAVLDVMLPGMSGIEFARLLKGTYPGCEIALVSGHPETNGLLDGAQTGRDPLQILPKPVDPAFIVALAAGDARRGEDAAVQRSAAENSLPENHDLTRWRTEN